MALLRKAQIGCVRFAKKTMKNRSLLSAAVLLLLVSLNCSAQTDPKTIISGEIRNFSGGSLQLFLEEDINRKKRRLIAEAKSDQNGRFKLVKELPSHVYTLRIGDKKSVMLAIEKGQDIFVAGDAGASDQLKITGSDDTAKLEAYEQYRKASLKRMVIPVRDQIKQLKAKGVTDTDSRLQELAKLEIENYVKHKNELLGFIKKEMGTSLAIYPTSIRWDGEKNIPYLRELSKQFQNAYPGTEIAARVNEKVETIAANSVGGKAAEINMPDKSGTLIPLSSIKARFILIDFWGSWCAPCRGESRLLSELYQKFNPIGFEIYGVGLESSREQWMKAMEQDKRLWTNVSTFQEFETPVTFDYGVTSLPVNVLIDSSGKVIARNLHGKDLRLTLEKLFVETKVSASPQ